MATKKRKAVVINASTMADIAFLLLVFFLVTTTVAPEAGMMRKLPPNVEVPPAEIPKRNVQEVFINKNNQLMVEGKLIDISELRSVTKYFLLNPNGDSNLPEKRLVMIDGLGERMVSKQVISLQNDIKTNYGIYVQVQDELATAYREARNELALQEYGKTYDTLLEQEDFEKANTIKKRLPQRISEAEPKI